MIPGDLTPMDPGRFLELTNHCGLELDEVGLAQLTKRKLLRPLDSEGEDPRYTELHLYVVARYFELAGRPDHPWDKRPADPTFDEISELASGLNGLIEEAVRQSVGSRKDPGDDVAELILDIERFLAGIDPFGPLADVFDLLRPSLVKRIRNRGRLYLELKVAVTSISEVLQGGEGREEPKTRRMYEMDATSEEPDTLRQTQVIDDDDGGGDSATKTAIDNVVSAADDDESAETDDNATGESQPEPREPKPAATQVIQVRLESDQSASPTSGGEGLDEESSDPIVLMEDDENDEKDETGVVGKGPPPSPAERIGDFSRRRESLTETESWEEVAELYEEGIGIFSDADKRRQLWMELARIYEIKLRDKSGAFHAFDRAWCQQGETEREEALEGIQRIGKSSGFHDRYLDWLRDQVAKNSITDAERARLHKELARGLFADMQFEAAFESYASFLTEDPEAHVTDDSLDQVGRLGEHVDSERLENFWETLREKELSETTQQLVEEFLETDGAI